MNIFKMLCNSCSFNPEQAAEFLAIREDTANSLWQGKREPADGIIIELKKCYREICLVAELTLIAGEITHDDEAVQRRMIEIMPVEKVLENFRRVDFKEQKTTVLQKD